MYEQYAIEDRWEIGGDDLESLWSWEKSLSDMGMTPDDWDDALANMEADYMASGGQLWNQLTRGRSQGRPHFKEDNNMKSFYERSQVERDIIRSFYEFEATMLASDPIDPHYMERMCEPNPFYAAIKQWDDGKEVIEALELAIELAFNR